MYRVIVENSHDSRDDMLKLLFIGAMELFPLVETSSNEVEDQHYVLKFNAWNLLMVFRAAQS